jgi:hypothetical protein
MPATILRRTPAATAVAVLAAALAVAALATAHAGAASGCPSLPRGSDPVTLDAADFSATIDNRQWPMTVGSRWVYRVTDMADGSTRRQVITVTHKTKVIADGIRARVVSDVVRDHGRPIEITEDWYAQDRHGNIWYFGEHTTAYDKRGKPTDNGTWQAGVNGALPGIALPAKPCVALTYREEYAKGVAEDQSRVLALDAQAQVRAGHYRHALLTEDFSPIEPDVSELKFYAKGSGQAVLAIDVSGGTDREELIKYTR